MKKLGKFLLIIVVILAVLVIAKNIIAKTAVTSGVKAITGLDLKVGGIDIGLVSTSIGIKDLKLHNPSNFKDRVMIDLPEAYIDYDLGAFLKKQVHLEEVRLNLKELIVIKNEAGELNLDSLKAAQSKDTPKKGGPQKEKKPQEMPDIQIDVLALKIGKVIYKDYSKGTPPKISEYNISLDERFEDITDPNTLVSLIITKALMKTALGNIANFGTQAAEQAKQAAADTAAKAKEAAAEQAAKAQEAAADAAAKAKEAAQGAVDKAGEALGSLFGGE
ncbi:AsmA family protein [Candidatus Omnitrophota bacterium]